MMKKKLDGGHKKFYSFYFLFIFFISNNLAASRILDHETENFITSIIAEIKNTNNINRDLKFTIISSNKNKCICKSK